MEKRLSKKDLMELYGVDRVTIEDWRRNRGLKMIEVSTHSKYITEKDFLVWVPFVPLLYRKGQGKRTDLTSVKSNISSISLKNTPHLSLKK